NCVYRGKFSDFLDNLALDHKFNQFVHLTDKQKTDGTREECVLRFFAFYHRYKKFIHSVRDFLNEYMRDSSKSFNYTDGERSFNETVTQRDTVFPHGLRRASKQRGLTSLILFEGIAVGAALAIQQIGKLRPSNVSTWLASDELREFTTGATNNLSA